jgi:uncharacterized protein YukE
VCDDLLNLPHREEIFVLDRYFIRPTTVDRIRSSWIGDAIDRYVNWLAENNYAPRSVFIRVPLLIRFGESAQRAGAKTLSELPAHIEAFIQTWLGLYGTQYSKVQRQAAVRGLRGPIQQMLRLTAPQVDSNAGVADPFAGLVPGFFDFLRRERGLREATLRQYRHYLRLLDDYLRRLDRPLLPDLPPSLLADFITESGERRDARSVQSCVAFSRSFFAICTAFL